MKAQAQRSTAQRVQRHTEISGRPSLRNFSASGDATLPISSTPRLTTGFALLMNSLIFGEAFWYCCMPVAALVKVHDATLYAQGTTQPEACSDSLQRLGSSSAWAYCHAKQLYVDRTRTSLA